MLRARERQSDCGLASLAKRAATLRLTPFLLWEGRAAVLNDSDMSTIDDDNLEFFRQLYLAAFPTVVKAYFDGSLVMCL